MPFSTAWVYRRCGGATAAPLQRWLLWLFIALLSVCGLSFRWGEAEHVRRHALAPASPGESMWLAAALRARDAANTATYRPATFPSNTRLPALPTIDPGMSAKLLELCVGLACFTGCMIAVDRLFLLYSTIFYKVMAFLSPNRYEPTQRYPSSLKQDAMHPRVLVQLPMFNETHVAARIIEYACRMEYPRDRFEVQVYSVAE